MRLEKHVKEAIKKELKARRIWFTMPYQAGYSQTGVPDFLCCVGGRFVAIEAKFGGNRPTPMQALQIAGVIEAGGEALIIDDKNVGELGGMLDELLSRGGVR